MKARRSTVQRRMLMEEIGKSRKHLTASELFEAVRDRLPHISLGTVYRNLELLAETGQIRKLGGAGQETRYDGVVSTHYHLRCRLCGRIDDAAGSLAVQVEGKLTNADGWSLAEPTVEFEGICPACRDAVAMSVEDKPINRIQLRQEK